MSLPSGQLDAFLAVARERHFSNAAKSLFITQSALSQRIKQLEETLKATLFTRRPHQPVTLTDAGETLLGYCVAQQRIAQDALHALTGQGGVQGHVRLAGFSSVMRSIVLPALAPLYRQHPGIGLSLRAAELHQLPDLLLHGEADYVLTTEPVRKGHVKHALLGHERNVLTRGKQKDVPRVFLDHDARDTTTIEFVRSQPAELKKTLEPVTRIFLDEVYSLYDGVRLGMGRAVLPLHLIGDDVRVEPRYKPLDLPVYLNWIDVPYESPLEHAVVGAVKQAARVLA